MHPSLELTIRGTARTYPLADGVPLTIGRGGECEVAVEDQAVSRRHCTIEVRGTECVLTDLQSVNGTFVNDRLVRSARLSPGDAIRVGTTELDLRGPGVVARGLKSTLTADRSPMESVIRKRFDRTQVEWLSTFAGQAATREGELGLLQRAHRHLSMIERVSELMASVRDVQGLADAILGAILDVTGGDRAALVLRRKVPGTEGLEVAAARGRGASVESFIVSRTLVADVIEKGVSTFAYDAVNDDRFSEGASVVRQQVRSVMCVPLGTPDDILGALYVDTVSAPGRFGESELELLAALGNQAGVALHRVRLIGELERLLLDTIRAIAATIDAKDGYTHRHSERVSELSRRIAGELGLSAAETETVELAALLHDVGKIAVPDSILNKAGRLTAEEFDEMKKHPLHGARILSNIQSPSVTAVLPGVRCHHERWDGGGYPDGLRGETIPLLGRILGAADFIDALTSARSYRAPMPLDEAIALLRQGSGTHFDPRIVDAVLALHAAGELVPPDWEERLASRQMLLGAAGPGPQGSGGPSAAAPVAAP
jgi:putative nucleotidyltransferase with HDIG domain